MPPNAARLCGTYPTLAAVASGLLIVATVTGCAARAPIRTAFPGAITKPATEDRAVARLGDVLDHALSTPPLNTILWGVDIRSLDRGDQIYSRNQHVLMMPASTQKIVTLAIAADRLGWDDRFATNLLSNGRVEEGVLHGDVIVRGSGDPTIVDDVLTSWARALRARGVHRITGQIVGDDHVLLGNIDGHDNTQPGFGTGWSWDDLALGYAAPVGPLQYRENVVEVSIEPGRSAGSPAHTTLKTPGSALTLINQVTTTVSSEPGFVLLRRLAGAHTLIISGQIAVGADVITRLASVYNPTLFFVQSLRVALEQEGVVVEGPAIDIDQVSDQEQATIKSRLRTLVQHQSEPLSTIAVDMMKRSQNLYAESVLQRLGVVLSGNRSTGPSVVASALAKWGISRNRAVVADGSGLSRYNYLTASALTDILTRLHESSGNQSFFSATLSVAGKDGTLRNRLVGTAAAENARAKTGSMSQVRSLAGFVRTADGEQLAFAILANNFSADATNVTEAIDAVITALATLSRSPAH